MGNKIVRDPDEVRRKIYDYYDSLEREKLWLPPDPSHRHFRFRCLRKDGHIVWRKIKDRIDTKKKLRRHLRDNYALDPYYTASSWLNPTELGAKDEEPLNVFLRADFILDIDLFNRDNVKKAYSYFEERFSNKLDLRFTGSGWHIGTYNWFKSDTSRPREREEECQEKMKELCLGLIDEGINFDYRLGREEGSIISPSYNSRGVFKLPAHCLTYHGTIAQFVDISKIDKFQPTKVMDIEYSNSRTFEEWSQRIDEIRQARTE